MSRVSEVREVKLVHLDSRDRRILKACVAGETLTEIAQRECIQRNAIKKRLDRINNVLPDRYRNRSKRILYPVLLLRYRVMQVDELMRLLT